MTLLRRGSAAKYHGSRRIWAQENRALFEGVPSLTEDVTDEKRQKLEQLDELMRQAGLFGRSPMPAASRRETIRRLVSELRGELRAPYW